MSISQDVWISATAEKPLDLSEMDSLVQKSLEAWQLADEKKKAYSEAYEAAEKVDAQIMEALKLAGKSKYFVDGVGTVSISQRTIVRVPNHPEAKKKFFKYLQDLGEGVFYSLATVNSNALNAWFNSKVEEETSRGVLGFSVPGIDDPTMRETIRFNKVRGKK